MSPSRRIRKIVLPLGVAACMLLLWHAAVRVTGSDLFPTPLDVARGTVDLTAWCDRPQEKRINP